jgi:Cu2+-exporting ATPase
VSTVYVAAVLILSAAGFFAWSAHGTARALEVTIAILVVTCPCALGLATPLAHDLIHGALRRRGVFVRDGSFLDRALQVRKILFDKTGTLTVGRLGLTDVSQGALERLSPTHWSALANLVARSNHPVSRCLTAELSENGTGPPIVRNGAPVREIAGEGLEWAAGDATYRLGRATFALANREGDPVVGVRPETAAHAVFSANGELLATFDFHEELRTDALDEIGELRREGYEIHLLSGDAEDRVAAAAGTLQIPRARAVGRLTPEKKAERVAAIDDHDTLMVGDGLNDRPSFDAAYAAATPAVEYAALPARADFYFLGAGISAVRASLSLARKLRTVVRGNLILAAAYNLVAIALCFAGVVTPVVAAVLMPLSSAGIVTLTATRLSEGRLSWK